MGSKGKSRRGRGFAALFFSAALLSIAYSQSYAEPLAVTHDPKVDTLPSNADEISVSLSLNKVGTTIVPAIVVDQSVYIPVLDVLDFVKIKSDYSPDRSKITGFFIDESDTYVIDLEDRSVHKGISHLVLSSKDIIQTRTGAYLRSDIFKKIFGIDCQFNFNLLDVRISCDRELPAVTEALRKKNSNNIGIQNGTISLDRNFPLERPLFSAGALDWAISNSLTRGVPSQSYYFALGADLVGGDFDARYTGSPQVPMTNTMAEQNLLWRWRYVMPESKLLSQINLGVISSMATTALADSVIGFQITNKPVQLGSDFGTYTIRDQTQPGWTVELYINNTLVKTTTADAGGNYQFAVPLSYGATSVTLKFYGPWGEVITKDVELRIPYTFLPPGKLEYTLTGGTNKNTFNFKENVAQFNLDAGVTNFMTVSGGLKYQQVPGYTPFAPFGSVSTQLFHSVLLNGEYIDGAGFEGHLSYATSSGIAVEGLYDYPVANQQISGLIATNQQRGLTVTAPISKINGSLALSAQDAQQSAGVAALTTSAIINGEVAFIPMTLSTSGSFIRHGIQATPTGLNGTLGFYVVAPLNFLVKPQVGYDYLGHRLMEVGATIQRGFGVGGQFQLQLAEDLQAHQFSAQVDLRYALPWTQVGASANVVGGTVTTGETAQGSIIFDGASREVVFSDRNFVDHGGILIRPFLDMNNNGFYDFGEPIVKNFHVAIAGGREIQESNGIIRIMDLDPYISYVLKNSTEGVENLAWVSKFQNYSVMVDANRFRAVNIPITVAGQIGGYIKLVSKDGADGLGGIKLKVRSMSGDRKVIPMPDDFLTYSTGEYYNIGLTPGAYRVYPDSDQMKRLRLTSDPPYINFTLKNSPDGDIIDTLNFLLRIDGGPDTTTSPSITPKGPSSPPHAVLKDIAIGQTAETALIALGKPKDLLSRAPLIAGERTILDTIPAGECRLPMKRTLTFDSKNILQGIRLEYHGTDYFKLSNADCVLYWLTDQYGYPLSTLVVNAEKQYRWQVGYTQLSQEMQKRADNDYTIIVTYKRVPGK